MRGAHDMAMIVIGLTKDEVMTVDDSSLRPRF